MRVIRFFPKSLAQKIFGSNLCLSDKKVVVINQEQSPYPSGSIGEFPSKTQWTALWAARKMAIEKPLSFVLEPLYLAARTYFLSQT